MTHRIAAALWRRRQLLECGCTEPCRCDHKLNPTPRRVDAYREAVDHLRRNGLPAAALTPECRELWHRGGADRSLAETLVGRWTA